MAAAGKRVQSLTGVVLHLRAYADSHRIVEALTRERGRVSLLARGARASRRRFGGALDLFATLRMQATEGAQLWTLASADIVDGRSGLRVAFERIERACRLCDAARALAAEHHDTAALFEIVTTGLDRLAEGAVARAAEAYPALLRAAGILPDVAQCARCGSRDVALTDALWSSHPGFLCVRCAPGGSVMAALTHDALRSSRCQDAGTADDVERLLLGCVEIHLGRRLLSRQAF